MKNIIQFILIIVGLSACANIKYAQSYSTPKGLDFLEKKYLLNDIYTPYSQSTYTSFSNELKAIGAGNIDLIIDARSKGVIIPQNMKFEIEDEHLDIIALAKQYDYLIQVSTSPDYETDNLQLVNTNLSSSRARITIRIYDVYTKLIIYDQLVVAISEKDNNDDSKLSALKYSAAPLMLTQRALKKALADINKYKRVN